MLRYLAVCALGLFFQSAANSQTPQTLSGPPDSPRWELQGEPSPLSIRVAKFSCLMAEPRR